jgi:hypothetical protein
VSLLFQLVFTTKCRNTHHRLAMDALRHLRGADAERWTDLLLHYHGVYLAGSKAPDDQFKDFTNHVLHVGDKEWGGAIGAARRWYAATVDALRRHSWCDAAYSAGVLSHYFSDPFMPLHTGQSAAEPVVHRALEWSIAKSYGELQHILEFDQGGYPHVLVPRRDDWLAHMIRQGAREANTHYQTLIDHYNVAAGARDPLAGMDQECKDRVARCLGSAVVGLARVLERAFAEAAVEPPRVENTLAGFFAALTTPLRWVTNQMHDLHQRLVVEAIYDEYQRTGKVQENLPEDERVVRQWYAEEILKVPLSQLESEPTPAPGQKHGTGAAERPAIDRLITAPALEGGGSRSPLATYRRSRPVLGRGWRSTRSARSSRNDSSAAPRASATSTEQSAASGSRARLRRFDVVSPSTVARPDADDSNVASSDASPAAIETTTQSAAGSGALASSLAPTPRGEPRTNDPSPESSSQLPTDSSSAGTEVPRFRLDVNRPIVDAPAIGNRTAERLLAAKVRTVGDLLASDPDELASRLKHKHTTPDLIRAWQAAARLVCRIPGLHGHDAQLLVACGITEPEEIVAFSPAELLELIAPLAASSEGKQMLRGSRPPDAAEAANWIQWARASRALQAA